MKEYVPTLELETEGESMSFAVCLPASQDLNLNPSLLTAALEAKFGVPAANASIPVSYTHLGADPLLALGHAGTVSRLGAGRACEGIDEGGFAHIGDAAQHHLCFGTAHTCLLYTSRCV